jgi:hypothetical protein
MNPYSEFLNFDPEYRLSYMLKIQSPLAELRPRRSFLIGLTALHAAPFERPDRLCFLN